MNADVIKILTEAADKLEQIHIGDEIFADEVVDPNNPVMISNHTFRAMMRIYEQSEKDPIMRKIFGVMLRVRIALALSDYHFRQRQVWEWWFMATYRASHHWAPDKATEPLTKQEYHPADPRNWIPVTTEAPGYFRQGVWHESGVDE